MSREIKDYIPVLLLASIGCLTLGLILGSCMKQALGQDSRVCGRCEGEDIDCPTCLGTGVMFPGSFEYDKYCRLPQEHDRTKLFNQGLKEPVSKDSNQKAPVMSGYFKQNKNNQYNGGVTRGDGWSITWKSPTRPHGPSPIEVVRGALDNIEHKQKSGAGSDDEAKLMVHLIRALEELDGKAPSIGGDLNALIPEPKKE